MKNKIIIFLLALSFNVSAQVVPISVQHDPVTITDGLQVDLSLTGQNISGAIVANSLDSSFIKDKTIRLLELNQSGASIGQFAKWDGNKWAPTTIQLTATASIDYPPISPLTSVTLTVTVPGATTQDSSIVQPVSGVASNMIPTTWVSGPDTVTVSMFNGNAIAIDLPSQTFNVKVIKN